MATSAADQQKAWDAYVAEWNSYTPAVQSKFWWRNPSYTGPWPAEVANDRPTQPIPQAPQVTAPPVVQPQPVAPKVAAPALYLPAPVPVFLPPDPGKEKDLVNPVVNTTPLGGVSGPQTSVSSQNSGASPPPFLNTAQTFGSRPWASAFRPPTPPPAYTPAPSQSNGGIGTSFGSGSMSPATKMSPFTPPMAPISAPGEVAKNQVPSTPNTGPNRGNAGSAAGAIRYVNQPISSQNQLSPMSGSGLRFGGF